MFDDGEQNPPPFHDVAEDTLLSSDESEQNPTLSDDGEEEALGLPFRRTTQASTVIGLHFCLLGIRKWK